MIHLSSKTEALAERLAEAHRLPVEEAIHMVLEQRALAEGLITQRPAREQSPEAIKARRSRTDALVAALAAMPVLDPRPPREIMNDLDSL